MYNNLYNTIITPLTFKSLLNKSVSKFHNIYRCIYQNDLNNNIILFTEMNFQSFRKTSLMLTQGALTENKIIFLFTTDV